MKLIPIGSVYKIVILSTYYSIIYSIYISYNSIISKISTIGNYCKVVRCHLNNNNISRYMY